MLWRKNGTKKLGPFLLNMAFCGIHLFISSTSNEVKNEKIFRDNDVLACTKQYIAQSGNLWNLLSQFFRKNYVKSTHFLLFALNFAFSCFHEINLKFYVRENFSFFHTVMLLLFLTCTERLFVNGIIVVVWTKD